MWVVLPIELFWTLAIWSHITFVFSVMVTGRLNVPGQISYEASIVGVVYTWVMIIGSAFG